MINKDSEQFKARDAKYHLSEAYSRREEGAKDKKSPKSKKDEE